MAITEHIKEVLGKGFSLTFRPANADGTNMEIVYEKRGVIINSGAQITIELMEQAVPAALKIALDSKFKEVQEIYERKVGK